MWSNFHTHSSSCDGKGELSEYVEQAKKFKLMSLGFSSHAPVPFPTTWCMKSERLTEYLDSIHKLKVLNHDLDIYAGLEIDFVPDVTSPNVFRSKLDYTIGSIHFVEALPDGTRWEIDGPHASFLQGFEKIFHSNMKDTIVRYLELTREMILTACPTIIGHMDKIKIQNINGKFFSESDAWYQDEIKKTIDLIESSGAIVEVNTRGIYQKKSATTYPSPWILEILNEKNIPVTINSDAHHSSDIINEFPFAAAMLKKIGFKTISILHEGSWKAFSFDEHGIKQGV
jgi:histidinol-phosphatase (PHP family)